MTKLDQNDPSEMTAQEVFKVAATHLLVQGVRSSRKNSLMEKSNYGILVNRLAQPEQHRQLVLGLQAIHDTVDPGDWVDALSLFARERGLSDKFLIQWKQ